VKIEPPPYRGHNSATSYFDRVKLAVIEYVGPEMWAEAEEVWAWGLKQPIARNLAIPDADCFFGIQRLTCSWLNLLIHPLDHSAKEAVCRMIVDDAGRLHPRVDDDGAYEFESPLLQYFG
jgi:hypothetical protein